ncbi:unnamed protein product, partial [Cylicostephanus goldi]
FTNIDVLVGFLVGNGFAIVGAILRLLAIWLYRPELLIIGRFLTSMCEAVTYQSCILFLQECSPTEKRGMMTFLSEISYSSMCLVGMMLGTRQLLGNNLVVLTAFPVPFCEFRHSEYGNYEAGSGGEEKGGGGGGGEEEGKGETIREGSFWSAIFFVALFFLPETPKFLLASRADKMAAERSVRFYHGSHCNVDKVLKEIILVSFLDITEGNVSNAFCHFHYFTSHINNSRRHPSSHHGAMCVSTHKLEIPVEALGSGLGIAGTGSS